MVGPHAEHSGAEIPISRSLVILLQTLYLTLLALALRPLPDMEPVSLALAVIGTLDLCVTHGKKLKNFCREQRNICTDIDEITLILEGTLLKTEVQLEILQTLVKSDSLQPALWAHYLRALRNLETKMSGALSGLECISRRRLNQSVSKFPLDTKNVYLKREIQELVISLEDWQRRFDPSWYLITLVSRPAVDKRKRRRPYGRCPPSQCFRECACALAFIFCLPGRRTTCTEAQDQCELSITFLDTISLNAEEQYSMRMI
ncbi:hypothetical protein N7507_007006 [Penicillium longicatenatum]|nr:hypothetical protein N7507_007006 [Penicillium longicatenatum]